MLLLICHAIMLLLCCHYANIMLLLILKVYYAALTVSRGCLRESLLHSFGDEYVEHLTHSLRCKQGHFLGVSNASRISRRYIQQMVNHSLYINKHLL